MSRSDDLLSTIRTTPVLLPPQTSSVSANAPKTKVSRDPAVSIEKDKYKERHPLFVGSQRFVYLTEIVAPELLGELKLHIDTFGGSDGKFTKEHSDLVDALEQVKTHVRYGAWESRETRTLEEADVGTVRGHQKELRRIMRSVVTKLPYWVECEWSEPIHYGGDDDRHFPPDYPRVMAGGIQRNESEPSEMSAKATEQDTVATTQSGAASSAQGFETGQGTETSALAASVEPSPFYLRPAIEFTDWLDNDDQWHDDEDPKMYSKPVSYADMLRKESRRPARPVKTDSTSRRTRRRSMSRDTERMKMAAFGGQFC